MSELYNNLRKGEDTFYRDVNSARDFFLGAAEKNGFDKWNLDELQEFEASNGQKFQLSLDERMSLYAYSLRPQARDHLTKGGIVLAENTKRLQRGPLGVTMEVTYDDANAYTLTNETIDAIVNSLTKEQQQFAYEMQQYLAKIMGAKGDEVNMAMYGIKKFGEETYWPLKPAHFLQARHGGVFLQLLPGLFDAACALHLAANKVVGFNVGQRPPHGTGLLNGHGKACAHSRFLKAAYQRLFYRLSGVCPQSAVQVLQELVNVGHSPLARRLLDHLPYAHGLLAVHVALLRPVVHPVEVLHGQRKGVVHAHVVHVLRPGLRQTCQLYGVVGVLG